MAFYVINNKILFKILWFCNLFENKTSKYHRCWHLTPKQEFRIKGMHISYWKMGDWFMMYVLVNINSWFKFVMENVIICCQPISYLWCMKVASEMSSAYFMNSCNKEKRIENDKWTEKLYTDILRFIILYKRESL